MGTPLILSSRSLWAAFARAVDECVRLVGAVGLSSSRCRGCDETAVGSLLSVLSSQR